MRIMKIFFKLKYFILLILIGVGNCLGVLFLFVNMSYYNVKFPAIILALFLYLSFREIKYYKKFFPSLFFSILTTISFFTLKNSK